MLKEEENNSNSNSISKINFGLNSSILDSSSNSNEEEDEHNDDSILIKLKKYNIYNKEKGQEKNINSFKNKNGDSLILNDNTNKNSSFTDDSIIRNSPTHREKRKRNKFNIFSDFFLSGERKNSYDNYTSFKDDDSPNQENLKKNNYKNNNLDISSRNDEKKSSLIQNLNNKNLKQFKEIEKSNKTKINLINDFSSPKTQMKIDVSSSFSSNGENKIDKKNYILESEINLSKPIAIKNIYNSGNSENQDKSNINKNEKIKTRSKIKNFILDKFMKEKDKSENKKNKDYKNLYENLNYSYSDIEDDNLDKDNFRKNKIEKNLDYETDPEEYRKIDEFVKREVNINSPNNSFFLKTSEKNSFGKEEVNIRNKISPDNNLIKENLEYLNIKETSNSPQNYKDVNINKLQDNIDSIYIKNNTDDFHKNDVLDFQINQKDSIKNENSKISYIELSKKNDIRINNDDDVHIEIKSQLKGELENMNEKHLFDNFKKDEIKLSNKNNYNDNIKEDELKSNDLNENETNFTDKFPKFEEIFGEKIENQTQKMKKTSPFGHFETFTLFKVIIKNGEDLRQEQFATQLINEFHQIFKMEKVDCWVNTYEILATGTNAGIIEVVPNSISIDQLKRKAKGITSLSHFFEVYYGPVESNKYKSAMKNFINSLAGYSLVCYFIQIKDRHNGNILIDDVGHLIHIDFGFMLTNAPGKGLKFEKAPFKLTKEFVDVMGGVNSKYFQKFRKLLWK